MNRRGRRGREALFSERHPPPPSSIILSQTREPETERPPAVEEALEALFERLAGLERETAALSESLRRFRDTWRERVGAAEGELFAAKRLEERIARLSAEAAGWPTSMAQGPAPPARRKRGRRTRPAPWLPKPEGSAPVAPWMELKVLYRLVVRRLHPDFARSDVERARSSELLARVNAAYARGDRVLIELVHARTLTEDEVTDVTPEKRQSHAERRLETLAPIAASLERELAVLRASSQFRDLSTANAMADQGRDYFAERLYSARKETRAAFGRALEAAAALGDSVNATRVRAGLTRKPDPGALLRPAARGLERQRAGREARVLTLDLERKARKEPWVAALAFFAFFAEVSPEPPPGLASLTALRERYEVVRRDWPAAPVFGQVLLALPSFLEVGLRAHPDRLTFGLQLKRPELLAGVRDAMVRPALAPVARVVFEHLGRAVQCEACGERVFAIHLMRARGAGDVHALVCPACAAVVESYRTLGRPEGLEALSSFARRLGVVVEQRVGVADLTLVLEFLPSEHERATARTLLERLHALYPAALPEEVMPFVKLRRAGALLAPSARLRARAGVRCVLSRGAPLSEKKLAAAVRAAGRISHR